MICISLVLRQEAFNPRLAVGRYGNNEEESETIFLMTFEKSA
jgi:hypothetical protein